MTTRRDRVATFYAAWAVLAAGCGGPAGLASRPVFAPPRDGVFQDPVPIVRSTNDDLLPSIVPASNIVVYASKAGVGGNLDIYARPLEGGAPVRLTTHSADDTDPELSPDGRRIAWSGQSEDVKGDIWVMDADGTDKRRLTDRATADSAPSWSPDGETIYFTSRIPGAAVPRVDAIDVGAGERRTVVERGWDPVVSPAGDILVYVALDDRPRPRIYAKRLPDGRVASVTDGAYMEGLPRVARGLAETLVLFTRWVDDQTNDGVADADDPPSLWSVEVENTVFEGAPPHRPRPLTPGEGGEIFASVVSDWLVYTTAGYGDLEIYALPADGVISTGAGAEAILAAARGEENPSLRRLALRYLVATSPGLRAFARYELARELAERARWSDAIDELERVEQEAQETELGTVAALERERLHVLSALRGELLVREDAERRMVEARRRAVDEIVGSTQSSRAVEARAATVRAELAYALGDRVDSIGLLRWVANDAEAPPEDGARALDRLGEIYAGLGSLEAVARVSEQTLRRFATERYYVRRAADRWVKAATESVGLPELAALEQIVGGYPDLPAVAARAAVALASAQERQRHEQIALRQWRAIAAELTDERAVLSRALIRLGEVAERQGDQTEATAAYERLIAEFPESPHLRSLANRGITRINLLQAQHEEAAGDLAKARESYGRVLRANRELVLAHRHFIALSARLGMLERVVETYEREAEARPRDKYARYGYGYALTFQRPVPLRAAEREIVASLTLDPRFAAGHLTLGWLREQRELEEERAGWLEKADESYDTARSLVDEADQPEIWAAAHLNRGNVLFKLGKTDDAFDAYLTRELSGLPFGGRVTELLFRERFSRVALREGAYDVALDMARLGEALSRSMPGNPRRGAMAALVGAVSLQASMYAHAAHWYGLAAQLYTERRDWVRVVPTLRGRFLAERLLGRNDEALETSRELLRILAHGDGPVEPVRGLLGNLLRGVVWVQEVPANAQNVTRGIYGFDSTQEEEIVRAASMRIYAEGGDLVTARELDAQRLELVRAAASDSRIGPRVQRELLLALHSSALLAIRASDMETAMSRSAEALHLAEALGAWGVTVVLLEATSHAWLRSPEHRTAEHVELARTVASAGLEATSSQDPSLAGRFARWLAIDRLTEARQLPVVDAASPAERLPALLDSLDRSVDAAEEAADYSRLAVPRDPSAPDLSAHLRAYCGETRPTARGPDDEVVVAAPLSWRWRFDRALWEHARGTRGPDPTWLRAAVEAFERQPMPETAPELGAFLYAAVELLRTGDEIERAWRLLERARLLDMVPPARRVTREPLASAWAAVRDRRDDPAAHAASLRDGPQLLRALEAAPATAADVSRVLGTEAVLVQAFEPLPGHWYWFVVDAAGVRLATTEPFVDDDLAPILAGAVSEEPSSKPEILYLDAGELIETPAIALRWAGAPLIAQFEVSEALSATYLIAAEEARHLTSEDILSLGAARQEPGVIAVPPDVANLETLERFGRGRLLIHFNLEVEPRGPRQVVLEVAPGTEAQNRLDLDRIAGVTLDGTMALVERASISVGAARAVAQAFQIAGIPTVAIGETSAGGDALRADLIDRIAVDRPATIVAQRARTTPLPFRLVGGRGLTAKQRVALAAASALKLISPAAKAFAAAREERDEGLWAIAQERFLRLLETVTFLRRPASFELMPPSKLKNALQGAELLAQDKLAQTYLSLGEVEEAAALQELIVQTHAVLGDKKALANDYLALGKTLSLGRRPENAADAFSACADLAAKLKETLLEADCRSRLGSKLRDLNRYDAAVRAYRDAIALYAAAGAQNVVYPRRFLGFLYADRLSDYDRAIEEFRAALRVATEAGMKDMAPRLVVDIARAQRQRGEYEQALAQVRAGEAMLREASTGDKSEAALEEAKIYWYRGNYRRALERQRRGLELARAAGDTFREIQAISLAGLIALNQGELELAERQIRAALDLSRITQRRGEQAAQLNNLGIIQRQSGSIGEAISSFELALAIDEELGSVEGRAYDLRNLAVALQRKGEHSTALERLQEALQLSREIGNRYNELQCLFAIGETLDALRRPGAQQMYRDATDLARRTSVPEVEWRSLYALGRLAEQRGQTDEARTLYSKALEVAERLGRGRSESSTQNNRDDLYADAIRTALDADDVEAAYLYLERSRARALLDVLATRTIETPGAEAKTLLDAELRTRELRVAAARDVALGVEEGTRRLKEAEAAHRAAMAALRGTYPRLARAFTIDPVRLRELSSRLPEGVRVASFFVGRRSTTALVISRDAVRPVHISVGHDGLARRVARLREAMHAFGSVDADLASLSHSVLEPLREAIEGARVLVVIPHGPLHHVPFAALTLDSVPLLERMVVARALSASMLADRLAGPVRPPVRRVVAVAAGADLPFAPLEARAIAGRAAVIGAGATEELVRTARADALDVAAHTELDVREPLGSAVVLSPAGDDDGRLEVSEVFALTSLPPLISLSACDSRGSDVEGGEWLGLGGAFLTAGVQTVVASSSRVSDLAAAVVMKRFYRAVRSRPAGEALRQAALSARRYFPHPAHWASFVLLGDFR